MRVLRNRFSGIAAVCVALASLDLIIQGCTTFGPVDGKQFIAASRPPQIWIWKADSSVVLVRGPHFLAGGDTLVGLVEGNYQEIPFEQVRQVKATRSAPVRTTALVVGGAGAIVITTLLLKKSTVSDTLACMHTPPCYCDPSSCYP